MKIHLDLDCYFVSAERTRHKWLKKRCVVVAKGTDKKIFSKAKKKSSLYLDTGAFNPVLEFKQEPTSEDISNIYKKEFVTNEIIGGVVIAKSYETKIYGIQTGMSLKEAFARCKELIALPSDHGFYQELSLKLKNYLKKQIPTLEQYSIDEFFGDLDGWIAQKDTFEFIKKLQSDVLELFDLPITIGASDSKWIAKLITDNIKPYGIKVVTRKDIKDFTRNFKVEDFPGIGNAITKKLHSRYIYTIGDLQKSPNILKSYGKMGKDLYKRIQGLDDESVIASRKRKSLGIGRNFKPINSREEAKRRVVILARYLSYTIIKLELNPTTLFLKIKYQYHIKSYTSISENRLFSEKVFISLCLEMLYKVDTHKSHNIIYIGLSVSNFLEKRDFKTLSLFEYENDKNMHILTKRLNDIRDKWGIDSIRYGIEI